MPGTTVNRGYPYPLPGDPANPPGDLQALAVAVNDDVDANLAPITGSRIMGHVRAGATQAFAPSIETAVQFQIEYRDTDDMVNTVSSPTNVTINTAGFYAFWGLLEVPTNLSWTIVVARFRVNGVEVYSASQNFQSSAQTFFDWTISSAFPCAAGDTVTMTFSHNSAGTMTLGSARELMVWRMAT